MSARLTDQQRRDRAMSEATLTAQADEVAEMLGWTWMGVGPLRTAHGWVTPTRGPLGKGWPDRLYLRVRDHRRLVVEFKKELEQPTADQRWVLEILANAGFRVLVTRPSTFDQLVEALR